MVQSDPVGSGEGRGARGDRGCVTSAWRPTPVAWMRRTRSKPGRMMRPRFGNGQRWFCVSCVVVGSIIHRVIVRPPAIAIEAGPRRVRPSRGEGEGDVWQGGRCCPSPSGRLAGYTFCVPGVVGAMGPALPAPACPGPKPGPPLPKPRPLPGGTTRMRCAVSVLPSALSVPWAAMCVPAVTADADVAVPSRLTYVVLLVAFTVWVIPKRAVTVYEDPFTTVTSPATVGTRIVTRTAVSVPLLSSVPAAPPAAPAPPEPAGRAGRGRPSRVSQHVSNCIATARPGCQRRGRPDVGKQRAHRDQRADGHTGHR